MQYKQTRFSSLDDAVAQLLNDVDIAAGNARARYITTVQGQEAVYTEKMRQAKAYRDAGFPADTTGYEMIVAEFNARETSLEEAALFIIAKANEWNNVLSPQIELLRVGTKNKLNAMKTTSTATPQEALALAYPAINALKAI